MNVLFTTELARSAHRPAGAHDEWRERVNYAVQDTLGVVLASSRVDFVRASDLARPRPDGVLSWLKGVPGDSPGVVLHNSVAAHALDFDDTCEACRGHYSGVVLPVLIALIEANPGTAKRLVGAYAYGAKLAFVLGVGINLSQHYRLGFHATCILSGVAAAAAGGYLLDFSTEKLVSVINLAASGAIGFQETFGTPGKPIQVGRAASNAHQCVALVSRGIQVPGDVVGGRRGLLTLIGRTPRIGEALDALAAPVSVPDLASSIKIFPCCYELQRLAHAVSQLLTDHRIDPDRVDRVDVYLHRGATEPLVEPWPKTPTEAKFSPRFTVAYLLGTGRLGLQSYVERSLLDESLKTLGARVHVQERDGDHKFATVCITSADQQWSATVTAPPGGAKEGWPPDLTVKLRDCLAFGGWSFDVEQIGQAADGLSQGSIDGYLQLMRLVSAARTNEVVT